MAKRKVKLEDKRVPSGAMLSTPKAELELVSTDDLLAELVKRHDVLFLAGHALSGGLRILAGGPIDRVLGLVELAKISVMQKGK